LESNKWVIFLIVGAIVTMAIGCVFTNCLMSYYGREPSQAFNLLTGGLVGSLSTMLVKTSPTQATTQVAVTEQPTVVPATTEIKT